MNSHRYYCQSSAQRYLDHMIPVPDGVSFDRECLCGLDNEGFAAGLSTLTKVVRGVYLDCIADPAGYGFAAADEAELKFSDAKAAESRSSPRRIISLLHTAAACGELSGGAITVDMQRFGGACAALRPMNRLKNTAALINKLAGHGFVFDGLSGKSSDKKNESFSLRHADAAVTAAMYGYLRKCPLCDPVFSLNYDLAAGGSDTRENLRRDVFAAYVSGAERDFFLGFDAAMKNLGVIYGDSPDYRYFSLEYLSDPKHAKIMARLYTDGGRLRVALKLRNNMKYQELLNALPEHIKEIFRGQSTCRFCVESCGSRIKRTFEDVEYTDCGYLKYFEVAGLLPEDMPHYERILAAERTAVTGKKQTAV